KEYRKDPAKYVMMPGMARKRHVVVEKRQIELKKYTETCDLNEIEWGSTETGVITSGISYQYAKEAFGGVSYLKLGMVYPLPDEKIKHFASKVDKLIIIEELEPFFEEHIKALGIKTVGKDVLPVIGEYSANLIRERLLNGCEGSCKLDTELPVRPPVMCPGCPHRGVFYVLKKLKLTVSGDIGCYTLGTLSPLESMDVSVCMGASIGMVHGMEKAKGREFGRKAVAVIGDSTFIHSGITGLINAAYNNSSATVIVLDNSITGMTGHQHNPMSGYNIKGEAASKVDLVALAHAIGINRVVVADPFDLKAFEKVVKDELSADEPSLIISRRPCALLKHVKYEGTLRISTLKCKNCGMCMKLGCPAIVKRDGFIEINEALCNGCTLCTNVCSFGAIEKAGAENE
ncbi:MAG: thiamine pyrophosphate-dependent enzyme, partial [Eubacteriales bacterium]|nr:thiamine pyrophosphate-dependent enzyme [Eubacteriales bacterium]